MISATPPVAAPAPPVAAPAPPVAAPAPPVAAPAPAVAVPAPADALTSPQLDLAGLEQRLRETPAIGMFTKLSLKNQVDDLLDQLRSFFQGRLQVQLAELRERYELLLFKVLTLLQDADRELAEAITVSREAIWGILTDPRKLETI